ncbi:MAG: TetR/AcrR family transcriptional regulator [Novosphingobium sp.]|nr:TetR/AcrR family transcriptional regulator [Novosphingobium sp.]
MSTDPAIRSRNGEETRTRIIEVAQAVFAEKGYPQAGMREIAVRAKVATSLLTKYFQTKANLFEQALIASLIPAHVFQADRARFGEMIVDSIVRPEVPMAAPAMIALSLGDAEASRVAAQVTRDHILSPMAEWLSDDGLARATSVLAMTMGFAILSQHLPLGHAGEVRRDTARRLAASLQAIIDDNLDMGERS